MKLKTIGITFALLAGIIVAAVAQSPDSKIKIYQSEPGIIKVIYAMELTSPLEVKFLNGDRIDTIDKIKGNHPKGILKRYDVHRFKDDFTVVLTTDNMTTSYLVSVSKDRKRVTAVPMQTTYRYEAVASNK